MREDANAFQVLREMLCNGMEVHCAGGDIAKFTFAMDDSGGLFLSRATVCSLEEVAVDEEGLARRDAIVVDSFPTRFCLRVLTWLKRACPMFP